MERSFLNNLASHLKSLVDSGRSSLQHVKLYNNTLSRLKALDLEIARGLQTRSRIKWVEEGESSSAFFLIWFLSSTLLLPLDSRPPLSVVVLLLSLLRRAMVLTPVIDGQSPC